MMMIQQQEVEEASNSSSHHSNKASPSPSFSSYSSETLAEIAARVIEELRRDTNSISDVDDDHDALFPPWENQNDEPIEQNDDDEFEFEFEFAFVSTRDVTSPVSADDIFYNGQIKPMYPIFGVPSNDAVLSVANNIDRPTPTTTTPPRRRLPLRKLMFEDGGETASCSSSTDESFDLEGVAEGAYCVWTPPNSVGRERKKSNSTGSSSKRWKLRDLLLRSHSEGKEKQQQQKQKQQVTFQIPTKPQSQNGSVGPEQQQHNAEQNKRKSFLPYRPELVGLFANVNGLGRNLSPF